MDSLNLDREIMLYHSFTYREVENLGAVDDGGS
jgi:hypothetical protein